MSEPVIQCTDLTKRFGSFTAVNKVSLTIPKGSIFAFLGPNGSGKSTTIRMICGVLTPTAGTGTVLGFDLLSEAETIKQHIGYMSQKFSLYEELTVRENLAFYAGIYGLSGVKAKEREAELIAMTGLEGRESQRSGALSGGWKQRLALACALLHRPELLILDEPTAGVDPVSRRIFWQIIRGLAAQGTTVLVSTHYMDEAETADQIGFIYNSRLLALGTPDRLKREANVSNLDDLFVMLVESDEPLQVGGGLE